LRQECIAAGKDALFEHLKTHLIGEPAATHAEFASKLDMTEAAVKVAVQRLRQRYRELLRQEVAHTLADTAEVDDEIRGLFDCLRT
jgi:hypothetical protein